MYTAKRGYRPGDEPVPQYHLTKFLGRGQFGEVWQAKGPGGMQVALKIIDLAGREGLKEFAGLQKVKDIRHANLVEFVACWVKTDDGKVLDELPADPLATLSPRDSSVEIGGTMLFDPAANSASRPVELIVAMSLGTKTLFRRLQEVNHGKEQAHWSGIPAAELLDYMEQAARGIDFLNQQGIIHGDIKPQNLLIVGNSVKVCDFGLAQAVDSLRKTRSGMGTVAYAAPELFVGKPHVQSDQYCLAISYVELRTGSLPFDEPNPYKVIDLHRAGKLDLTRLNPAERKIIRRATELKPEKRWPSCFEMVSRLRESVQAAPSTGFWPSLFGVRSLPTERLPRTDVDALDEVAESKAGGQPAGKQQPAATPPIKPDSTQRKSEPVLAVEARVARTHPQRRDETDEIAATLPSAPAPEPARAARRSWVGRLAKTALALGALTAIGWAVFKFAPIPLIRFDRPVGPSDSASSPLELARREYRKALEAGDFEKAAEVVGEARKSLSAADYLEEFEPEVRKAWNERSTNPVLRQLLDGAIPLQEALVRLRNADADAKFVERLGPVPEDVWRACFDAWTREFHRRVLEGDFQAAVQLAAQARQALNADRYQQLVEGLKKTWSDRSTHPILIQLRQDAISPEQAYLRLQELGGVETLGKLVGPVAPDAWQALADAWRQRFEALLAKDLAKAVESWEAVDRWQKAPTEAISPAQTASWRDRLQEEWKKQIGLAERVAKSDFRGVRRELEQPLAKKIFDATAMEGLRKAVQPRWTAYFDSLIHAPDPEKLAKASEELKDVGPFFDAEPQLEEKAKKLGDQWRAGVRDLAKKANWAALAPLLEAGKGIVPPKEHEAERAFVQSEFGKSLAELIAAGKFREAGEALGRPPAQQWLGPDGVQAQRASLGKEWIQSIRSLSGQSGQEDRLLAECDAFVKMTPEPSDRDDARLLRARALVRLGRADEAQAELQALQGLAQDRARLRDALLAIATNTPRDPKAFVNLPVPWKLNSWEEQQLQGMARPPKPDDSPGAIVKRALEAANRSQAAADTIGPLLDALEKHFPPAAPEQWKVDDAEDVGLLSSAVPAALEKLAAAAGPNGAPAYEHQGKDLARAAAWLVAARDKFRRPRLGAAALAAATARLAIRVWEPARPGEAELLREIREWEELSKGRAASAETGVADLMAKAWKSEALLTLGREVAPAANTVTLIRKDLKEKAKQPAYAHYLSCLAMRAEGGRWDDLTPDLLELAPAVERGEPILQRQRRAAAVAEWIVQAAADRRRQSRPWTLEKIPFNPFATSAEAEQYAGLLKSAGAALAAQSGLQLEWKRSRVLAEFHRPKPALGDVWTLAHEVLTAPNAAADPDAVPLLYAAACSFWKQPELVSRMADDPQGAAGLEFTVRLLRALGDDAAGDFPPDGPKTFHNAVVEPILQADILAKAKAKPPDAAGRTSELAGALAEFLEQRQDAPWPDWPKPFQDVHDVIASLASGAIELGSLGKVDAGRIGDYYALRAKARANRPDFDPETVLADVAAALKHGPTRPYLAYGAQAYALLERAGQRDKRDAVLRDLSEAIAAGEQAVKSSAGRPKLAAVNALNLAIAHLRMGNYETDAKKKERHFTAGRDAAIQAAKGEQAFGEEARLLLGNLYEDLASQLGESPRENYQEALRQFSEVLRQNRLSAQAAISHARCAFKAVRSGLDPQLLGLGDRDAALKECVSELNRALQVARWDSHRTEAHYYLGQVYDALGDIAKADDHLGKAADLAIKSHAASRAASISRWAELALRQANRLRQQQRTAADPEERKRLEAEIDKKLQAAEQRAEILRAAPARGFQVPAKNVALILGEVWRMRKQYDRAVGAYDAAIPDVRQADAGDVPLLLARAQCSLERFDAANQKGAKAGLQEEEVLSFARAAIRDAGRARELALSPADQAEADYLLGVGHFGLFRRGGSAALEHRDQFLQAMRSAVRLEPSRAKGATYRHMGAAMILTVLLDWHERIDKNDQQALADFPKQALPFLEEAHTWAKEALQWEQESRKKPIQDLLNLLDERVKEYRSAAVGAAPNN